MRNSELLDHAVCKQHDPDLWIDDATEERAVALCKTGGPAGGPCPALAVCLDIGTDPARQALTRDGVWGGMNTHKRARIRAQRARGIPMQRRYQTVTFTAPDCQTPVQESSL